MRALCPAGTDNVDGSAVRSGGRPPRPLDGEAPAASGGADPDRRGPQRQRYDSVGVGVNRNLYTPF